MSVLASRSTSTWRWSRFRRDLPLLRFRCNMTHAHVALSVTQLRLYSVEDLFFIIQELLHLLPS